MLLWRLLMQMALAVLLAMLSVVVAVFPIFALLRRINRSVKSLDTLNTFSFQKIMKPSAIQLVPMNKVMCIPSIISEEFRSEQVAIDWNPPVGQEEE